MPDANTYSNPIKIYEYMALEKAIVAPRISPIEEIITEGSEGLLFKPKDQESMNQALISLYHNRKLRMELGRHAREKVLRQYTWVSHAESICKIAKLPISISSSTRHLQ